MRFLISRTSFPVLAGILATPAAAQFPVHVLEGDEPGDAFGAAVSGIGDIDNDGFDEFIVGAKDDDDGGMSTGEAFVFSGLTGAVIYNPKGTVPNANFGDSVAGGGDLDNDTVPDFIVGSPWFAGVGPIQGQVTAFSGATGLELWNVEGPQAFALFGETLDISIDVDGDGHSAALVGAPNDDGNNHDSGIVYVLSGVNGAVLYTVSGDGANDQLGFSLDACGDVDGDMMPDFIAGAPFVDQPGSNAGHARVFSGASGGIIWAINGQVADDRFGRTVAGLDDINNDGRADFAVGTELSDVGGNNTGSVTIFSGLDASIITTLHGSNAGDGFGFSLTNVGDYDADGQDDLAIGVKADNPGGTVRIFETSTFTEIGTIIGTPGAPTENAVAGNFDINGDGNSEVITGRRLALNGTGEATVYSTVNLLGSAFCFGDGSGTACPCGNAGGSGEGCGNSSGSGGVLAAEGSPSTGADDLQLNASNLLPNQPALAFVALNATSGGAGLVFGDGLRCAGGSLVRLGIRIPDANGDASWGPGLAAQGGWVGGDLRRFQGWYRDPAGSPCGNGFNLTNGFEITFVP